MKAKKRNRTACGIAIIIVIVAGLASRRYSSYLPELLGSYSGDILWALMVYLAAGFIFKKLHKLKVGITALAFSYFIEISQLYHGTWIDSIRKTTLGALVLGFGFLWSDLICYTIGVVIGIIIDDLIL